MNVSSQHEAGFSTNHRLKEVIVFPAPSVPRYCLLFAFFLLLPCHFDGTVVPCGRNVALLLCR